MTTKLITVTATNGQSTHVRAKIVPSDKSIGGAVYTINARQYQDALNRITDKPGDWLGYGEHDVRVV